MLIGQGRAPDRHGLMVSDKSQSNELFFEKRNENCNEYVNRICINYPKYDVGNKDNLP